MPEIRASAWRGGMGFTALLTRSVPIFAALAIVIYFVALTAEAFQGGFNRDDLMNLHAAWSRGLVDNLIDTVLFFRYTPTYRPVGAVFYERVFAIAGFTPTPYRAVLFLLLIANFGLIHFWTRALGRSRLTALLSMLLMSFHGWLTALYIHIGFCFDILCFFFYYLAFNVYLRLRRDGKLPRPWQMVLWAALYVLALGSKEMAVSLPVILLLYELLYHPPDGWRGRQVLDWLIGAARVPLLGAGMTVLFLVGRLGNPLSLIHQDAYRPHISLARYIEFCSIQFRWLLYQPSWSQSRIALWIALALLLVVAVTSRERLLGAVLLLVGILPVAFIGQRGFDSIYVALPGLALAVASTVECAARMVLTGRRWTPRAAAVLFVLCFGALASVHTSYRIRGQYLRPEAEEVDIESSDIHALQPILRPGSRILVLRDGLPDSAPWSTGFLIHILTRDLSLDVRRLDTLPTPLRPNDLAIYDIILTRTDGHLRRVPTARFRSRCLAVPLACAE